MTTASFRLPTSARLILEGIENGLHTGAQLYVSLGDDTVADSAFGEARPGVPMTTDTIVRWMSAVKPLMAVAIAQLWEAGRLDLDDPVVRHIPSFTGGGKDAVTLRHLLTHTAGLPYLRETDRFSSSEEVLDRIYEAPLQPDWNPGSKAGYDPGAGWFVLAEVVRRLAGVPFEDYVCERILKPLKMSSTTLAMTESEYDALGDRASETYRAGEGGLVPLEWGRADLRVPWPGGSGRGPIRELGWFYEMLRDRGKPILSAQSVEALTARHRVRMVDQTFAHIYDWGLGFMLNSRGSEKVKELAYDFGAYASPRAFGHGGSQCATGFCDPEHGLVVAWAFNGLPGEARHRQRNHALNTAIYADLGLVTG